MCGSTEINVSLNDLSMTSPRPSIWPRTLFALSFRVALGREKLPTNWRDIALRSKAYHILMYLEVKRQTKFSHMFLTLTQVRTWLS